MADRTTWQCIRLRVAPSVFLLHASCHWPQRLPTLPLSLHSVLGSQKGWQSDPKTMAECSFCELHSFVSSATRLPASRILPLATANSPAIPSPRQSLFLLGPPKRWQSDPSGSAFVGEYRHPSSGFTHPATGRHYFPTIPSPRQSMLPHARMAQLC